LNRTVIRLGDHKEVYLDDEDVTEEIRKPFINEMVSPVSAQSVVRRHLVALQQQIASETNGIIMEGRDTTSVVLPDADFKFYLDASLEERTRRRNREQLEKGIALRCRRGISADCETG
jgi:cytidylate kinase